MTRLDPRSPMVLDTNLVGRRAGSMHELTRQIGAPEDFGTDVIAVPTGDPLVVDVRLESVVEGVLVTGSVRGTATGACVRCLERVDLEVDGRFQELFAYTDRRSHHREVGDDEAEMELVIEDGLIDLEATLRDTVVPALPFQPVCRPDCPGLCSTCGQPLAEDPEHRHDVIDPRWAALTAIVDAPAQTEKRT